MPPAVQHNQYCNYNSTYVVQHNPYGNYNLRYSNNKQSIFKLTPHSTMKKLWKYLENQFESATFRNYKKAIQLSNYHDADLNTKKATQPLLVPIYNRYIRCTLPL